MLTPEQIETRKKGIGGSEIAALMGLNPYLTPLQIYYDKLGIGEPFNGNKYTRAGNKLERIVKEYFEEETGYNASPPLFDTKIDGIKVSSPDFIYRNYQFVNELEENNGVLECKTTQKYLDEPEDSWVCQGVWYAGNLGYTKVSIAWLERGVDFKFIELDFNTELYQHMVKVATTFWNNHIITRIAPEPINRQDVENLYPNSEAGSIIEAKLDLYNEYLRLKELQESEKETKTEIDRIKTNIALSLKQAETLKFGDSTLATYKTPKPSLKFDTERFCAENPVIFNQYLTEYSNGRRLLIK